MFKEFDGKPSLPKLEEDVLKLWQKEDVFKKSLEQRKDAPLYIFYEGPPTANGKPGIHHVLGRTIKDVICRYKSMSGYQVPRKAGWDTHGLPVEIAVEKKLGLTQKNEIEGIGIEKFNTACRELVDEHIEMSHGWRRLTDRMGYWLDLDDPYITYKNEYVESVWWAISEIYKKGYIYKSFRIVPQSPTIETPLSSHELSLGYKDVKDPNTYVKVKVLSSPKESLVGSELLIWTTTPWTLLTNTAAAVAEEIDYVRVQNTRELKSNAGKEEQTLNLVLAKERLSALDGEYEILEEFKGKEIVGTRYEQIFDFLDLNAAEHPNVLSILPGNFVTTADGSGIVHMAPAFGQDDYEMSKLHNLPVNITVTPGGRFKDGMGEFSGRTVKTFTYADGHTEEGADKDIIIALKKMGKAYRITNDYLHSYPHCWRTDNPVIYYAREAWFINSPAYRERMIELNNTINWQPPEIGKGRFGNWLEDNKEWSLSRDRYWGTPLPIWVSEDGDLICIGSIAELKKGIYVDGEKRTPVGDLPEGELDLHRPFVDNIIFVKDGKEYRRTPEIIDVWFDSGAMPFAQLHYPFENKELFDKSFPADYISEGVDQTRGWFYTLHNLATVLFDSVAFKNIIVNDLLLDKNGKKMSKRLGNAVDPFEAFDTHGADALRWYLLTMNNPWIAKRFDSDGVKEVYRKLFDTLLNTYSFFALYANIDGFDGTEKEVPVSERPEIDRWILSRLYTLSGRVNNELDNYDLTQAARPITEFVIDELSNWYVRRNRRRFWKGDNSADKTAAYQTLHEVLLTVCKLMAPFCPFVSDALYRNLKTEAMPESVHFCDFPTLGARETALQDEALESRMSITQRVVRSARALREDHRLKVRQPLQELTVYSSNKASLDAVTLMSELILEELNVKTIAIDKPLDELVTRQVKPNFKTLGPRFGKSMKQAVGQISAFGSDVLETLESGGSTTIDIDGKPEEVRSEDLDIREEPIGDAAVTRDGDILLALDTTITPELAAEGIAREFINRIQNLRKDANMDVMDRIVVHYSAPAQIADAAAAQAEYIRLETLATELHDSLPAGETGQSIMIDDDEFSIFIRKSDS